MWIFIFRPYGQLRAVRGKNPNTYLFCACFFLCFHWLKNIFSKSILASALESIFSQIGCPKDLITVCKSRGKFCSIFFVVCTEWLFLQLSLLRTFGFSAISTYNSYLPKTRKKCIDLRLFSKCLVWPFLRTLRSKDVCCWRSLKILLSFLKVWLPTLKS